MYVMFFNEQRNGTIASPMHVNRLESIAPKIACHIYV